MEARPIYRTAEELDIEQWEHDGLVALVGPLSRGELELDMSRPETCDTIHCIGGWLAALAGLRPREYVGFSETNDQFSRSLRRLFYPNSFLHREHVYDGWHATAPQAARAVVNFLVTGDPQWDRVMSEPVQP